MREKSLRRPPQVRITSVKKYLNEKELIVQQTSMKLQKVVVVVLLTE